jgi:hypothetical protein
VRRPFKPRHGGNPWLPKGSKNRLSEAFFIASRLYSAEVFSVPAIAKLQRHDAGRARIAAIAS